jgi:hypothetical protein
VIETHGWNGTCRNDRLPFSLSVNSVLSIFLIPIAGTFLRGATQPALSSHKRTENSFEIQFFSSVGLYA